MSWALTAMAGLAGVLLTVGWVAGRPASVGDWLSGVVHVAGSVAMTLMAWPWGTKPQIAAFALAAAWFGARAARGVIARSAGRWADLHHAAMAGALAWSIAQPAHHHHHPAPPFAAVVFSAYFLVAAWPWLYAAFRTIRSSGRAATTEPLGHAVMSIGMAAMFTAMT
ncbi:DUF5134 domain-containing protein [Actinoplanes sp. CA-142083]|uniref:DUF5134 domain-containing protein n=1 Tax=Actinoplanes sp. CA-142083 TaxID=3239903 RepID=UPI003D8E88E2